MPCRIKIFFLRLVLVNIGTQLWQSLMNLHYEALRDLDMVSNENYNLEKLTTEIDRVSNREDIKNELTNNFTEYSENNDITNLVNKSINLVDIIFKMIIDKGILTNTPLQKYKSYINMIKIYSQGENQKEMLTQLIYDLNQLKNVVESYDILTDTAESPQTSSEEDTQEEGTKLLNARFIGFKRRKNFIEASLKTKDKIIDGKIVSFQQYADTKGINDAMNK